MNVSSYPSILEETAGTSSVQTKVQFQFPPRFQPPTHNTRDILAFPFKPSLLQGTIDARSSNFNSVTDSNVYSGSNVLYQSRRSAVSSGDAGGLGISSDGHGFSYTTQTRMSTSAAPGGYPPPFSIPQSQQQHQSYLHPQPTPFQQPRHQPQPQSHPLLQPVAGFMNDVDTWIDALDANRAHIAKPVLAGITPDVAMAYPVQQSLPCTELPKFDGSPTKWVNFIT